MTFIEWTENESVRIKEIDVQHKNIADIINRLYFTIGTNRTNEAISLMKELMEELEVHFETEERLMKEKKYVNFFSHKMEHDRLLKKVYDFYDQMTGSKVMLNLEFAKSLKNWFFNHIELNDKKCGEYLYSHGLR
ncbi:MAG: bacteriohemerythrin [Melioribacteraceae bacterium]|nr:bacteriohemerythrin [Melioribacteraceae bacterium]MCF8353097.1 bacteriohemerythrin [Melioribacteraceae bacterium]MCF8392757.1 bacteriohemerythrin [Melioribacteraceae bacterium]MCF8418288.1 bacteriohemerythrin [Melioribacteraceae bacterium]